jgi:hypothetical protein
LKLHPFHPVLMDLFERLKPFWLHMVGDIIQEESGILVSININVSNSLISFLFFMYCVVLVFFNVVSRLWRLLIKMWRKITPTLRLSYILTGLSLALTLSTKKRAATVLGYYILQYF